MTTKPEVGGIVGKPEVEGIMGKPEVGRIMGKPEVKGIVGNWGKSNQLIPNMVKIKSMVKCIHKSKWPRTNISLLLIQTCIYELQF